MRQYIYISDMIEIDKGDEGMLQELSPYVISIAEKNDFSTTYFEQSDSYLVMFTYNVPRVLSLDEMKYLDERFQEATLELRSLLFHQKVSFLFNQPPP